MKGVTVNLPPSDVLHIPGLGFDGLVGYSPIAMAKNAIGMAIACEGTGLSSSPTARLPAVCWNIPAPSKTPNGCGRLAVHLRRQRQQQQDCRAGGGA